MATSARPTPTPIQPNLTHNVENVLAFRTQVGAITIPGGQTKLLGVVDVSMYDRNPPGDG
jgi:hypothetical protein